MSGHDTKLVLFGASGHAKVVIDLVEKEGKLPIGFLIDDNTMLWGQEVYGYPVAGGKEELKSRFYNGLQLKCLVAIGDNQARANVASWLQTLGIAVAEASVHPSAQLARGVVVEAGTILMAFSAINSDSIIGSNVIVNTAATIDHDCVIGDAVHVAPGATLCGCVSVGSFTLIGAGAIIHPHVRIGNHVIVGAGATVLDDVPDNTTVVGTPARKIVKHGN